MAIVAGKFKIEKEIGRGAYATVYSAVLLQPYPPLKIGDYVAIKSISTSRISTAKEKEKLENEINLMKTLNHQNIVRLYGVERLRAYYFLIMEYCNYGDLIHFLHSFSDGNGTGLPEDIIINFMYQIGSGLNYLHSHQIVHRDLKPHNILILKKKNSNTNQNDMNSFDQKEIDNFTLKIADFGFARFLRPSDLAETICGSPVYMAPEIQFGTHYTSSVDMWSLGVIIYELIAGKTPFPNIKSQFELAQELKNRGSQPYFLPVSAQASDELREIIPRLLTIDSEKRMTLDEFLSHPIFKKFQNSNQIVNSETETNDQIVDQQSSKTSILSETPNDSNEKFYFSKYSSINRNFSFIAADGNLTPCDAQSLLIKSKEAALLISDSIHLQNQIDELKNSLSNQDIIKLNLDLSTTISCFLLDFLFEFRQLMRNSQIDDTTADDITEPKNIEKEIIDIALKLSENANLFKDQLKNSSYSEKNDTLKIGSEQYLYNVGLKIAMKGAEMEKKDANASDYLNFYKKALLFLMPIAYKNISDEFTIHVRDIYLKISNRCDSIEKKEKEPDQ